MDALEHTTKTVSVFLQLGYPTTHSNEHVQAHGFTYAWVRSGVHPNSAIYYYRHPYEAAMYFRHGNTPTIHTECPKALVCMGPYTTHTSSAATWCAVLPNLGLQQQLLKKIHRTLSSYCEFYFSLVGKTLKPGIELTKQQI